MTTAHSRERTLDRTGAETLLYREARLLDTLQLEEWLTLFTEDGVYWLPMEDGDVADARTSISIVYDDTDRRAERVYRTLHTPVLDQKPRSRTMHVIGNVEIDGTDERGDTRVLCNQIIGENRPGGDGQVGLNGTRVLLARCDYRVRGTPDGWRISMKKMLLLNADQPIYNLTFLL